MKYTIERKAQCTLNVSIILNITIPTNIHRLPPFAAGNNNLTLIKYFFVVSTSHAIIIGTKIVVLYLA